MKMLSRMAALAFRGIAGTFRNVWVFFVRWFLPVPAVDAIEDRLDEGDETAESGAQKTESSPAPQPLSEPSPEIRPPEGAEQRAARGSDMVNPFE